MTPLEAALVYARRRWPVLPCKQNEPRRKSPIVRNGFKDATYDETQIVEWWRRYPGALIGVPTGRITGFVVLDIDVKRPDANGFHGHGCCAAWDRAGVAGAFLSRFATRYWPLPSPASA